MTVIKQVQKWYKGNPVFFNDVEVECSPEAITEKEKHLMDYDLFGVEFDDFGEKDEFAVLDDVSTLKNLMAFAEITRFRETLLVDMEQEEREKVTEKIINNLDRFHTKPIGYEIKEESIVLIWYLNSVINTFTFSDQSTGLTQF